MLKSDPTGRLTADAVTGPNGAFVKGCPPPPPRAERQAGRDDRRRRDD